MHTINIQHLKSHNIKSIEEYLLQYHDTDYQIIIPKNQMETDDKTFISWQYYTAAFVGYQLSIISKSFAYNVPCSQKQKPFLFEIETDNIKKLSVVLRYIIIAYYTDGPAAKQFHNDASQHFHYSFTGKTDPACWGLLHIANEFQTHSP